MWESGQLEKTDAAEDMGMAVFVLQAFAIDVCAFPPLAPSRKPPRHRIVARGPAQIADGSFGKPETWE